MRFKMVIAIVLAVLLVVFSLQNIEQVAVKFLTFKGEVPTVLLIIGTFAMGVIVGILASLRPNKTKSQPKVDTTKTETKHIK